MTFFRGSSLRPAPPGGTGKDARWIDVREDDLDEPQLAKWVKQAAAMPGWTMSGGKAKTMTKSPSKLIDERIKELGDWRGDTLARVRRIIKQADPDVVEEWKWRGVPVWEHDGIICTGETYKSVVKLTFAKGASLDDPKGLFNSSLEGNTRRAIDIREGEKINEAALKALIRAAVALNHAKPAKRPRAKA